MRRSAQNHMILTKHKSSLFVFLVCMNAALSAFFVGYSLVYISTFQSFQTIIEIYDIRIGGADTTQSLVTGCVPIGAMLGALLSSILLRKLSRRYCFLLTNILALVALAICFIKLGPTILIGRFLIGMCTGIYSAIVPLYINQFVPLKLKNIGTINQVFIASAQSFAFFFYYLLTDPLGVQDKTAYNWISNFFIVTIAIQTVVFLFVFPYQTPKYWSDAGQDEKCKQLLSIIYEQEWVQEVYEELGSTRQKRGPDQLLQSHQNSSASRSSAIQIRQQTQMPKIAIFLAIHVALFQQLTGVNSVALYGGKIVNQVLPDFNKIIPIFTTLLPAIAAAFTTTLMRKYGRKTLLQFGGILLIIPLAMMCIGFGLEAQTDSLAPKILVVVSLFLYMGSFGLTLGPIVWLIIPEFVQPRIIPYSTMANLTGAAFCIIIFPIASAQLPNKAYLFGIYLLWGVGSLIINNKYLVQTKDKTKQQIYKQLRQVQNKSLKD